MPLSTVKPVRVTGHIASLKWSRPAYTKKLKSSMKIDYSKTPSEDFASLTIEFDTPGGIAIGEATTSWSFVGAGLRLSAELLGPEYSMKWNSLDSGLQLFFSREVTGRDHLRLAMCPVMRTGFTVESGSPGLQSR